MFIKQFEVSNYKIHKVTTVNLYPITVFVGSNNGGKSALFDSILNFSMVSRGKLSQAFGLGPYSYQSVRHHGASAAARIRFRAEVSMDPDAQEILRYSISYTQRGRGTAAPEYVIHDERLERVDTNTVLFDRDNPDACEMTDAVPHLGDDRSLFAAIRQTQVAGDYVETDPLVTHVARQISRINKSGSSRRTLPDHLDCPTHQ